MFFIYLCIFIIIAFLALCSFVPFFLHWDVVYTLQEEADAKKLFEESPPHIKKACSYQCPQCGCNELLPDKLTKDSDIKCYCCGHLWHSDYILDIYNDGEDL